MGRQSIYINSLIKVYISYSRYKSKIICIEREIHVCLLWKVEKKVLKAKIKSLIIYNQYIYSHKPGKKIMTREIIYSQIFNNMVYDLFFLFPFFFLWILLKLIVLICMYHFFLAFWHLFARVAFRFIRPDSYKNSNWLCNMHVQWN